jgi:hypothetical protein
MEAHMQLASPTQTVTATLIIALLLLLSACSATKPTDTPTKPTTREGPEVTRSAASPANAEADINAQAEAYAKRLAEAVARSSSAPAAATAAAADKPREGDIEWIDDRHLKQDKLKRPSDAAAAGAPIPENIARPNELPPAAPAQPAPPALKPAEPAAPTAAAAAHLDRHALIQLVKDRIKESNDPGAAKALSYAGLALADPQFRLDDAALADLSPSQRYLARQLHELFSVVGRQVADGQALDRQALADRVNALTGEQPIAIRAAKLCERVRGFGVYEELPTTTLLAGREHPMVIYVEVDQFKVTQAGGTHQVKLAQELVLYNESDGLAVWRLPEEQITDESRNRRRDFYIVHPTRLPARLTVGKYVLKIRVRDLQGATRDEVGIPLQVVADPALVKPHVKDAARPG